MNTLTAHPKDMELIDRKPGFRTYHDYYMVGTESTYKMLAGDIISWLTPARIVFRDRNRDRHADPKVQLDAIAKARELRQEHAVWNEAVAARNDEKRMRQIDRRGFPKGRTAFL